MHFKISWQHSLKQGDSQAGFNSAGPVRAGARWGCPEWGQLRDVGQQHCLVQWLCVQTALWWPGGCWGPRTRRAGLLPASVIVCAEPRVMAEELLLLAPRKKHLSGQQKTEIGSGKA